MTQPQQQNAYDRIAFFHPFLLFNLNPRSRDEKYLCADKKTVTKEEVWGVLVGCLSRGKTRRECLPNTLTLALCPPLLPHLLHFSPPLLVSQHFDSWKRCGGDGSEGSYVTAGVVTGPLLRCLAALGGANNAVCTVAPFKEGSLNWDFWNE